MSFMLLKKLSMMSLFEFEEELKDLKGVEVLMFSLDLRLVLILFVFVVVGGEFVIDIIELLGS